MSFIYVRLLVSNELEQLSSCVLLISCLLILLFLQNNRPFYDDDHCTKDMTTPCLVPRSTGTFLETFNCDYAKLPKQDRFRRKGVSYEVLNEKMRMNNRPGLYLSL